MLIGVNICQQPAPAWLTKGAIVSAPALLNPLPSEYSVFTYNASTPYSLAQYNAQWVTETIPSTAQYVYNNDYFAFLRVGGFHPLVIERVNKSLPVNFPMTDALLHTAPGFKNDNLKSMIKEGRLFIADYKILNDLQPGSNPVPKFVYCPIGLFGMTKNGLYSKYN